MQGQSGLAIGSIMKIAPELPEAAEQTAAAPRSSKNCSSGSINILDCPCHADVPDGGCLAYPEFCTLRCAMLRKFLVCAQGLPRDIVLAEIIATYHAMQGICDLMHRGDADA
jgi:hypothetical protein